MFSDTATQVLGLGVLVAIGLGLILWVVLLLRRLPLTPTQAAFYLFNVVLSRTLWRARVSGPLPVQPGQGAVVVCNHRSPVDPCFIELTTTRVVHWMVAQEYWKNPALGWFFRMSESIPVSRRGIDTAATKAAIRYVQRGDVVGMFPEGRLNVTDRVLLPGRPGAALVALKARAPVIPCYISGSPFKGSIGGVFFLPAKVYLKIGRPMDLSEFYGREKEREVLEEVTRRFLIEIAALAGQRDYQPELAGRFYKPGPGDQ
jgi:1-acyl-sn-glycerol-3-phosphate acyltransferase